MLAFGPALKEWRTARGLSQERLAAVAEVSARHLSFLENGRAAPSREMVLVLANALDLPLRERNALLGRAGFAAVYGEASLEGPELAMVRQALDHLLAAHEPFGAVVVDRAWNVRRSNGGATRLLAWALGDRAAPPEVLGNVVRGLLHPEGLREVLVNWDEVAGYTLERLRHEQRVAPHPDVAALLAEAERYEAPRAGRATDRLLPVLPVHLRRGGVEIRLFTTVTTLGTPQDVTAQELRIESYFPADEPSAAFVRGLAS